MKKSVHGPELGTILCRSCGNIIAVQDTEKVTKYYLVCEACRHQGTEDHGQVWNGGSVRE